MSDVILLSHGFQSEYEIGFANGLARNGLAVTLIGSDNTLVSRAAPGVSIVNLRGSQDTARPRLAKATNLLRYVWRYLVYIAAHRGTPVHVTGLFSTSSTVLSLVEAWLTRLCAGPYMLTVHNVLPHERHTSFNRRLFGAIYRAPTVLMVHTHRVAETLHQQFGMEYSSIHVVDHGFDRVFAPDALARAEERTRLGVPAEAPLLLLFGKVARYKGVDHLLEAFSLMDASNNSTRLLIAGRCRDTALRKELQLAIATHPCRERITWLDAYVPEDRVGALMQAADCLVMPYRHIDQSGVLFMAMSAGLPVVATRVGALQDFIRPGAGETVALGDPAAIAAALARTLAALPDRASLIAAASHFEWCRTVKALEPVYRGTWRPKPATGNSP